MASLIEVLQNPDSYSRYTPDSDTFIDFYTNLKGESESTLTVDSDLLIYEDSGGTSIGGADFVSEELVDKPFPKLIEEQSSVAIGAGSPHPNNCSNISTQNIHAPAQTVGFPKLKNILASNIYLHNGKFIEITDTEIHIYPGNALSRLDINMTDGAKRGMNRSIDTNLNGGEIKYGNNLNVLCVEKILDLGIDPPHTVKHFSKLIKKKFGE